MWSELTDAPLRQSSVCFMWGGGVALGLGDAPEAGLALGVESLGRCAGEGIASNCFLISFANSRTFFWFRAVVGRFDERLGFRGGPADIFP